MKRRAMRNSNIMAPRPVHPTSINFHGLFGMPFVKQHMMIDERWTPTSLTDEFKGMADLLSKRLVFKKLEFKATKKRYVRENRNLRRQCRDGRSKLQLSLYGENRSKIRNFLINHKDMQRLYQKMPVHLVVDNINQRTFVMRKERDRLRYKLNQLKQEYEGKLLERSVIENRIRYENEFVLEEDIKSRQFRKLIENSNVRLKAIKTINNTYKKMIQVLQHDAIFYDPIVASLNKDIDDQTAFIKHILFLGMPAIQSFKELSEEYRQLEEKSRKNILAKQQFIANMKKDEQTRRISLMQQQQTKTKQEDPDVTVSLKRYVRETDSMTRLKNILEEVENTIKQVKFATLCSRAKEIYPRIKSQMEHNEKLQKVIENDILGHQTLEIKMKRAEVLEGVLVNNLSEEEIIRLEQIKDLQDQIETENALEAEMVQHMKNRGDAYVLLRVTLWNLNDILRHVDKNPKITRTHYPNSYLRLPLLKFEMLTMKACAPEIYEENIDNLMHLVKRKLHKLMKAYTHEISKETQRKCTNEYHRQFLESMEADDTSEAADLRDSEDDALMEAKIMQSVPSRKHIKAISAKIVEELSKKDD